MGYFDQASDFTIDGGTMNDVAGDYVTNNDTKNDNRSNCNNKSQSTVRDSHNDHSKKVLAGGKTTNNNNGGGSFYQANGEQNIYASPPVPQARQERPMRAMAANPPRRALGAAKLAARGGGVARPRQVIDQRPHNPTYPLPPSSPSLQEAWPEYAPAPPRFKSNNPFAKLAQGYAEQPRSAERPPFRETQTMPSHGDDNDWFAELHGTPESEGDRSLYDERSYSAPVGSRRRY